MAISNSIAIAISKLSIPKSRPLFPFILNSSSQKLRLHPRRSTKLVQATDDDDDDDEAQYIIKPRKSRSPGARRVQDRKKLSYKELGISLSNIPAPTKFILKELKKKVFVRDLILKRVPKDFDILTSDELRQVIQTFRQSRIVGKRFSICHVQIGDHIVEVLSFSTSHRRSRRNLPLQLEAPIGCSEEDTVRWRNCMERDFTINGLMFNPFARLVYDYTSGLKDLQKAKVRTVIPANFAFHEDCARILRAIRIAACLGFRLAKETALSVRNSSYLILRLEKIPYGDGIYAWLWFR